MIDWRKSRNFLSNRIEFVKLFKRFRVEICEGIFRKEYLFRERGKYAGAGEGLKAGRVLRLSFRQSRIEMKMPETPTELCTVERVRKSEESSPVGPPGSRFPRWNGETLSLGYIPR